jgi:hypothetical protein
MMVCVFILIEDKSLSIFLIESNGQHKLMGLNNLISPFKKPPAKNEEEEFLGKTSEKFHLKSAPSLRVP